MLAFVSTMLTPILILIPNPLPSKPTYYDYYYTLGGILGVQSFWSVQDQNANGTYLQTSNT